jgi:hypothetical protein
VLIREIVDAVLIRQNRFEHPTNFNQVIKTLTLPHYPEFRGPEKDIRISRGRWTLPEGIRTEIIRESMLAGDEIAGYDRAQNADHYEDLLADRRG